MSEQQPAGVWTDGWALVHPYAQQGLDVCRDEAVSVCCVFAVPLLVLCLEGDVWLCLCQRLCICSTFLTVCVASALNCLNCHVDFMLSFRITISDP